MLKIEDRRRWAKLVQKIEDSMAADKAMMVLPGTPQMDMNVPDFDQDAREYVEKLTDSKNWLIIPFHVSSVNPKTQVQRDECYWLLFAMNAESAWVRLQETFAAVETLATDSLIDEQNIRVFIGLFNRCRALKAALQERFKVELPALALFGQEIK